MDVVVGGQFKIVKKIGSGSFGEIFEAISIKRGHKVAVKLENINSKFLQLQNEGSILEELLGFDSVTDKGLPNIYSKGTEGEFNYLVMDLLGSSLETLLGECEGIFTLKTTLILADQMLKRIEYVHSKGYVHRDVKPENFLESIKKDRKIYLIDFGLSKKIIKNGKHVSYADGKSMIGTLRYSSLNNHYGIEPTRRDDLESWFYCLCLFMMGELPWQNQKAPSKKDKYEKILGLKLEYRPEILCKNFPVEFCNMQTYIRSLKYDEKPNYEMLKLEIKNCMKNKELEYDFAYDWEIRREQMSKFDASRKS